MTNAAVRDRWIRTASVMAVIVNMHKAKGPTVSAEAFMPPNLRSRTPGKRESVSVLKGLVAGMDRTETLVPGVHRADKKKETSHAAGS